MIHAHTADYAELSQLEHHFPISWALAGLLGVANIAATIFMLLSQA